MIVGGGGIEGRREREKGRGKVREEGMEKRKGGGHMDPRAGVTQLWMP